MKQIFRSIKYFSRLALQYFLMIIAMCVCLNLITALSVDGKENLRINIYCIFYYLLFFSLIMMVIIGIVTSIQLIPLILSYNCTRRNAFFGMTWMLLLLSILVFATIFLFCGIFRNDITNDFFTLLPSWIGLTFISMGLSQLFSGICSRFGKLGMWLMFIVCLAFGFVGGFFSSILRDGSALLLLLTPASVLGKVLMSWNFLMLLIGIIIYLIGSVANYFLIRKAVVRI